MTIELTCSPVARSEMGRPYVAAGPYLGAPMLAICNTPAEAEAARLAFERVLLPRFTADEAVAIVNAAYAKLHPSERNGVVGIGVRLVLEALAAAGAFVPDDHMHACRPCGGSGEAQEAGSICGHCNGTGIVPYTMADRLDRAGIR